MKKRVIFLTYYHDNRNSAPSGGEIYHERVFAPLRRSSDCEWVQRPWDSLPAPFRFKGLSHVYYAALFLFGRADLMIIDAGYLGRCALFLFLLRLRGIPLVLVVHHLNFHLKANPLARAYDILCCRLGFMAAGKAIINSEFTRDEMDRHFRFRKPVLLLHPSLSLEAPAGAARAPFRAGETIRCLCVASVEPRKNLEALVELANRAPDGLDFVISVAGKETLVPGYAEKLRASLAKPGRLRFLGYVDAEGLRRLYGESRLFLFPSRWEGFGMAVLEALTFGLPVVAFAASATPYLIEPGVNGVLVPPYDAERFTAAAVDLMANPDKLAALAANCRLPDKFKESWEAKAERAKNFLLG